MREVDCSRWTMDADTNKKNHLNPKNNNPLLTYLLYLLYQTLLVHRTEKHRRDKNVRERRGCALNSHACCVP